MLNNSLSRRRFLSISGLSLVGIGVAACSNNGASTETSAADASSASTSSAGTSAAADDSSALSPTLDELKAEVQSKFTQENFVDGDSGKDIPFNLFLPEGYSESETYPLVVFIPDASLVGKSSTDYLSVYGALIWASSVQQAKEKVIVAVPQYDEVIIDDNNNQQTVSDLVPATARFIDWLKKEYRVDTARVYGTGQSMGCMTTMYLAAQNPELYTAVLLVSGQWTTDQLGGLEERTFTYIAAAGDAKASQGQKDVEEMLKTKGSDYAIATKEIDATASIAEQNAVVEEVLTQKKQRNFVTFAEGTVIEANTDGETHEHMASFACAYKISALRDWLLEQQ